MLAVITGEKIIALIALTFMITLVIYYLQSLLIPFIIPTVINVGDIRYTNNSRLEPSLEGIWNYLIKHKIKGRVIINVYGEWKQEEGTVVLDKLPSLCFVTIKGNDNCDTEPVLSLEGPKYFKNAAYVQLFESRCVFEDLTLLINNANEETIVFYVINSKLKLKEVNVDTKDQTIDKLILLN